MTSKDEEPPLVEREDGSWLVSGAASADLLPDRLGVNLPRDRDFSTVAGFALSVLKHLPETGETFSHDGWKFEVVDMDGRKIDKLLASRRKKSSKEQEPAAVEQGRGPPAPRLKSATAFRSGSRTLRCRLAPDSRPVRLHGRAAVGP